MDRVSGELTYGKQFYNELLARFSCINKLITGLTTITLRVRRIPPDCVAFNRVKRQVWDRILRTSQKIFPPKHTRQLVPETSRTGVLITKNRLNAYGLVKFHKAGQLGIVSHVDEKLCNILLRNSHAAVNADSITHCPGSLTHMR